MMRKLIATIATAGAFSLAAISMTAAAPVEGFEDLYAAAFAACTPGVDGGPPDPVTCEGAINAYSAALVNAGVAPAVALASFTELRAEVIDAGGGEAIENLFEELLPESGAIVNVPLGPGGGGETTGGGGTPASPG
jgi:hypothetical protein